MTYAELIDIKANLLCNGLNPTDTVKEIKRIQNPFDDPKTGNEGIFITLDNGKQKVNILVSVSHKFDKSSEYEIRKDTNNTYKLFKINQLLECKVLPFDVPKWYDKESKTTTGKEMSKCFLHEGGYFLHQFLFGL